MNALRELGRSSSPMFACVSQQQIAGLDGEYLCEIILFHIKASKQVLTLELRPTAVDNRLARFISRFPLRLRRIGIRMMSSEMSINTCQCYRSQAKTGPRVSWVAQFLCSIPWDTVSIAESRELPGSHLVTIPRRSVR